MIDFFHIYSMILNIWRGIIIADVTSLLAIFAEKVFIKFMNLNILNNATII